LLVNRVVADYLRQGTRAEFDERVVRVFRELRRFSSVAELQEELPALARLAGVQLTLVTDPQELLEETGEWEWRFYGPSTFIPQFRLLPGDEDPQPLQELIPLTRDGQLVGILIVEASDPARPARQDLLKILVLVALVGLGLAVLLAWLLSSSLTRPISQLQAAAELAGHGDWDRAQAVLPPGGDDELGTLAREFRRMGGELQHMVELLQAERDQLRQFIAELSHELKTPLTALQTFSDLLLEGAANKPEVREEFLEQIQVQVRRLDRLTENLLALSKLDAGLVELSLEWIDLRETVAAAVERNRSWARRKAQEIHLDLPGRPVPVQHDPFHTGRMLDNLLTNAVKYTPEEGEIYVRVVLEDDAGWVRVVIWDTGSAVSEEDAEQLFERFYRGRAAAETRHEPGSGLGLAIVRAVAEAHGGTARLSDASQAEFTIRLPAGNPDKRDE
jgi:signal transduction histidine kinase